MGGGRFSDDDWKRYATARGYASKTTADIFDRRSLDPDLDPRGVKVRESRDSADNPASNAIIIGLDVTGSMGHLADVMARKGLPTLVTNIYDRKPVSDPHVLCAGIGDAEAGDSAPLQVTQFEADIRIAQQLEKIWLESGGGGNYYESYILLWYFAAMHTSIDCFEKRGKKGYLFTAGDERITPYLRGADVKRVLGYKPQFDRMDVKDLFTLVSRQWEVFHLLVEEGSHFRGDGPETARSWNEVLGQRAIRLSDHTKMAEVIVSTIQVCEGANVRTVADSWDGSTQLVVSKAVGALTSLKPEGGTAGVIEL